MSIAAALVNYHTEHLLPDVLAPLVGHDLVREIFVIDNSGGLQGNEFLLDDPKVRLLGNETNIGFGAAVNMAAKLSKSRWLLIINPDMLLLPGCIDTMFQAAQVHHSPLVGPRFYWDEDRVFRLPPATGQSWWLALGQNCGSRHWLDRELYSFYWTLRHDRFWSQKEPFFEPFLSGACLLVDLGWLQSWDDQVFDARYFLYYEDTDLCVRVLERGQRPLCIPTAEVVHFWNQAPGENKMELMGQACTAYWHKHYQTCPGQLDLVREQKQEVWKDLGPIGPGFEFTWPEQKDDGGLFFEFGLDPLFVPFAQARIEDKSFVFPASIWDRLAPGTYFTRIRCPVQGEMACWRWSKD
ncbi:MAG: glycosyltransferase family 2 protein [Desulfovermiculus sp.]